MDDLLRKLNTLVSAQVNDLAAKLPSLDRKPGLSRQVADLRQRVGDAMAHEERLRADIAALQREIAALDEQVNTALQSGQEPVARALLEQMQRLERRVSFAEADLRQHQTAAIDLMQRVGELEAVVLSRDEAAPSAPTQQVAPTQPTQAAPITPQPAAQPAEAPRPKAGDPDYTAKDLARDAREQADQQMQRTSANMEQTGGLLRDIQARAKSRMAELDRLLREGGLLDPAPNAPAQPPATPPASGKGGAPEDIDARIQRLVKPD
jgi:hypothetical protein